MNITIEIPTVAAIAAQEALKDAAWKIAKGFANAVSLDGHEFFSSLAPTEADRAEVVAKINGLMNAAAVLDGRAARDDWAESMIRECEIEIEE